MRGLANWLRTVAMDASMDEDLTSVAQSRTGEPVTEEEQRVSDMTNSLKWLKSGTSMDDDMSVGSMKSTHIQIKVPSEMASALNFIRKTGRAIDEMSTLSVISRRGLQSAEEKKALEMEAKLKILSGRLASAGGTNGPDTPVDE
jgi:hypothetical protein